MKDGFYWARFTDGLLQVVEVRSGYVRRTGDEDEYDFGTFEEFAEFLSTEPLTPPVST